MWGVYDSMNFKHIAHKKQLREHISSTQEARDDHGIVQYVALSIPIAFCLALFNVIWSFTLPRSHLILPDYNWSEAVSCSLSLALPSDLLTLNPFLRRSPSSGSDEPVGDQNLLWAPSREEGRRKKTAYRQEESLKAWSSCPLSLSSPFLCIS